MVQAAGDPGEREQSCGMSCLGPSQTRYLGLQTSERIDFGVLPSLSAFSVGERRQAQH